jgi:xylan 1,4-beta-xylosidase
LDASGSPRDVEIHLTHLPPNASFLIETLDRHHGDAVAAWESMGKPDTPTQAQTAVLRDAAWATQKEIVQADSQGRLDIQRKIDAWSLVMLKEL